MLRSYLITALRQCRRAKGSTTINVMSFAAALACCAIIGLYIRFETSYDDFHEHADRTFRLATETGGPHGRRSMTAPPGLASALLEDYPEVLAATAVSGFVTSYIRSGQRQHPASDYYLVDSMFFDVFSYPLLEGSPETALDAPDAIVITESVADYFFPEGNALGRPLTRGSRTVTVTGVAAEPPGNSHIHFSFLERRPAAFELGTTGIAWNQWGEPVYVVLNAPDAAPELESQLNREAADQDLAPYTYLRFSAQRLTDIHLHSNLEYEFATNSDVRYVYLLGTLAILLILVAGINFVNIATARYSNRALEVGVRKVLGAHRAQLARQFIGESVLLTLFAGAVAILFVLLMRPVVGGFTGNPLPIRPADGAVFLLILLLLGVLTGSYPALFLSHFHPVSVLKGVFRSGSSDVRLRRILIGVQLVATIGLATGAAVIYLQIRHLQDVRLGFDRERVLIIDGWTGIGDQYAALREELLREPSVASVTTGYRPGHSSGGSLVDGEGEDEYWLLHRYPAGYDYLETMGIRLVAGRYFSPDRPSDSTDSIILSESAVERLDLEEPVVGRTLEVGGRNGGKEIIGIVEDFNVLSFNDPVAPVMISFGDGDVLIKTRPGNPRVAVERIEAIYDRFQPDRPMIYSFLDEEYAALFREERRFGLLFSGFSLVAVIIAFFGLAALASYTVERRTREIGIRKVLGAGTTSIVRLIAGEFIWLALIATIVAVPPGYLVVRGWLDDFVVRVDIGPAVFVGIILATIGIVLAAVSSQVFRASHANPAVALRNN
jgi:putative ABC transport system permease protein